MKWTFVFTLFMLLIPGYGHAQPADANFDKKINAAIDRGVEHLRDLVNNGFVSNSPHRLGISALVGWTLLESGVAKDDPAVEALAATIRAMPVDGYGTYVNAVALIFLDRLGDPADKILIQYLATRLLEVQDRTGGWGYGWADTTGIEQELLTKYYELLRSEKNSEAKVKQDMLQRLLTVRIARMNSTPLNQYADRNSDNSNTQFAALALWVARRHGVPVDRALQFAELRFRTTQTAAGRWQYLLAGNNEADTLSMTCAGLIVIALGRATVPQVDLAKSLASDPNVQRGFGAVTKFIKAGLHRLEDADMLRDTEKAKLYYGLWSLERTGMIYGIEKIHGVDWYRLGAKYLVDNQEAGGNWRGYYDNHYAADTCFALLFLRRANPAKDLATKLKNPKQNLNLFAPIENVPTDSKKSSSSSNRRSFDLAYNAGVRALTQVRLFARRNKPDFTFLQVPAEVLAFCPSWG